MPPASTQSPTPPGAGPLGALIRTVFWGLLIWWFVRNWIPLCIALVIFCTAWHKQIKANHRGTMMLVVGLIVSYAIVGMSFWKASALVVALFFLHRQIMMVIDIAGPMHFLSARGQVKAVEMLLKFDMDYEALSLFGKQTPLHHAAFRGEEAVVSLLINKGANIKAKDPFNRTPLHFAAGQGNAGACKLLIEAKCPADVKANSSATPLHLAAESASFSTEVAAVLVNAGGNIDAQDDAGGTVLQRLSFRGLENGVKFFLDKGAKVDLAAKSGATALHLAAMANHAGVVQLLVAKGASKDKKITSGARAGQTPLDLASNVETRLALGEKLAEEVKKADEILLGSAKRFSSK